VAVCHPKADPRWMLGPRGREAEMSRTRCRPEEIAATALAAGHPHQRRESASPEAGQTSPRSAPSAEGRACRSAVAAGDASTQDLTLLPRRNRWGRLGCRRERTSAKRALPKSPRAADRHGPLCQPGFGVAARRRPGCSRPPAARGPSHVLSPCRGEAGAQSIASASGCGEDGAASGGEA
jgi:hypothetical protein